MSGEWKPGDVAQRTGANGEHDISFVVRPRRTGDCAREHCTLIVPGRHCKCPFGRRAK